MTNIVRHAAASIVEVELITSDTTLTLEIRDNGKGLGEATDGLGILGMRERAYQLGGELVIVNRPEGGCLVRAQIPIDSSAKN